MTVYDLSLVSVSQLAQGVSQGCRQKVAGTGVTGTASWRACLLPGWGICWCRNTGQLGPSGISQFL